MLAVASSDNEVAILANWTHDINAIGFLPLMDARDLILSILLYKFNMTFCGKNESLTCLNERNDVISCFV